MLGDGGLDQPTRDAGDEERERLLLAQRLLLEAVDCLRAASELVADRQTSTTLDGHADALAGEAASLAASGGSPEPSS